MKVFFLAVPVLVIILGQVRTQHPVPGLAGWKAALAAHSVAEENLEKKENAEEAKIPKESSKENFKEAGTKKISTKDKGAFRDILKSAVNKLLLNIGKKKSSSSAASHSNSGTSTESYLDKLLVDLEKQKDENYVSPITSSLASSESSIDQLIRKLKRKQSKKFLTPSRIKDNRHKLASSASFLDKILNNSRNRQVSSRRSFQRSNLDYLLSSFDNQDDYYDYDILSSSILDERPRSSLYFDDYEDSFRTPRAKTGRLRHAMRESKQLDYDLNRLLDGLQRRRDRNRFY